MTTEPDEIAVAKTPSMVKDEWWATMWPLVRTRLRGIDRGITAGLIVVLGLKYFGAVAHIGKSWSAALAFGAFALTELLTRDWQKVHEGQSRTRVVVRSVVTVLFTILLYGLLMEI